MMLLRSHLATEKNRNFTSYPSSILIGICTIDIKKRLRYLCALGSIGIGDWGGESHCRTVHTPFCGFEPH